MSKKSEYQLGVDRADACLRQVFITGKSLLRHAQKLHEEISFVSTHGLELRFVPRPEADDSTEERERLERMRSELPSHLASVHKFADGCASRDQELRAAVRDADAALIAVAPLVDVATVSTEDRTTVRIRRQLRSLLRRTPSPVMAGWAQVAEPGVRERIEEALARIAEAVELLQLAKDSDLPSDPPRKRSKRTARKEPGRPPEYDEVADEAMLDRYRKSGLPRAQFVKQQGLDPKEFKKAQGRERGRRRKLRR